ncbi:trypsin-like peptidase domain-containing protein [uncultured Roseobacter sp.]|uniref:trypsin-like peptidase domain-containing protein n=1 Tax=uncultured Roseobacter sp. TaxID=114847 RepID=UPI002636F7E4|nr:trypsin-like peptidase domain-containing protein [uncultured Roseobacter sp.]
MRPSTPYIAIWRLILIFGLIANPAFSEADRESARSVVKITCKTGENQLMKATGFVWPEPGYVVTALHAVAGCLDVTVFSESAKTRTGIKSLESVDLEADLALLRLEDDLGLQPVPFVATAPALRDRHSIWGYPAYAEYMENRSVDFSRGLSDILLSLGSAFSSEELKSLFRSQDYPTRRTQIFRVTSNTQPGHSGAPILDAEGKLVAIHNGGLKGGWLGMNWSIPAHVYLPGLPKSQDAPPTEVSQWAALQSAVTVDEQETVVMSSEDPADVAVRADAKTGWHYFGWVSLAVIEENYALSGNTNFQKSFDIIRTVHDGEHDFENLGFEIWKFGNSAATVAVPSGVQADVGLEEIQFSSKDELFELEVGIKQADSFEIAFQEGVKPFFNDFQSYFDWDTSLEREALALDADLEYAFLETYCISGYDREYDTDAQTDLMLAANGALFFGAALTSYDAVDCEERQNVFLELMRIGFDELTGIEGPPGAYIDAIDLAALPSELTLVRRVPLKEVARDFVDKGDFGWKQDVFTIKELLGESAYGHVSFDVYEDTVTGATVAVPTGMELKWNDDLEMLEVFSDSRHSRLNIALTRANSFDAARTNEFQDFSSEIYDLANWAGSGSPEDCENAYVDFDAQKAECGLYLQAEKDGRFADIYLAMSVAGDVFLGSSVLILDREDDLSAKQRAEHRIMRIAAEHLSDFALH